ncbi:MAG: ParB N-terminal domain-containing protein [Leptospiraceae bacterium]|nr:ParB N-terminal domain-containing protein [Leptospiraceae bacterium]MCB1305067.1 ParB N-terminal domain-containing protein [Leptospiraceae bacterium]
MKLRVSEIKLRSRIRMDPGDLSDLMQSMRKYGLIHPVLVDTEHRLVAGYRRLCAARKLDWENIDVRVVDIKSKKERLMLEIEENRSRRNFSPEDLDRARRLLDRSERAGFFSALWSSILDFFERIIFFFRRGRIEED